jgi:hypothetical protein
LRTLLIETARECEQEEDGWILGADFGLILKKVKKYDPQKSGKRLADLFQDYLDLFEIRRSPFAIRLCSQVHLKNEISSSVQNTVEAAISVPRQLTPQEKAMSYESFIMMIDQERNFGYIKSPWRFSDEKMNNFAFSFSDIRNTENREVNRFAKVRFNLADDPFRSTRLGAPIYKAVNVAVLG